MYKIKSGNVDFFYDFVLRTPGVDKFLKLHCIDKCGFEVRYNYSMNGWDVIDIYFDGITEASHNLECHRY